MYNIKIYDRNGIFLQILNEKEISCDYSFPSSLNAGYGTFSFEYYGKTTFEHKQRIKVYKSGKTIYQGFISGITKKQDKSGKKQIIKANGLKGLLAYFPYPNGNISGSPSVLIRNLLLSSGINFDLSGIKDYEKSISLSVTNDTYLSFLDKILKQIPDWGFFIDAENKVWFTPFENKHLLTYGNECYNIEITEDSTNYYNKITLKYAGGEYTDQDNEAIEQYGINHLKLEENEVKDLTTAKLRLKALLKEKGIITSYKVFINANIDYYTIKPGDIISIRNIDLIIEEKVVQQMKYGKNTATITLDSYESLEQYLKK